MTPAMISEEFNLSLLTIYNTKLRYGCTYKELYYEYKERLEILRECQDLCIDIYPSKIQHLFGASNNRYKNTSARNFLNNLYVPFNMPRQHKVERCKQIIEYLRSNK
jgi:hypothetical protein